MKASPRKVQSRLRRKRASIFVFTLGFLQSGKDLWIHLTHTWTGALESRLLLTYQLDFRDQNSWSDLRIFSRATESVLSRRPVRHLYTLVTAFWYPRKLDETDRKLFSASSKACTLAG